MKNRPERQISFLVVWLTMFSCICAQGQVFYPEQQKTDFLQLKYPRSTGGQYGRESSILTKNEAAGSQDGVYFGLNPLSAVPKNLQKVFYTQQADLYFIQSGFFCKREWELEKTTHIPFRFRLGSLAECNELEGKH